MITIDNTEVKNITIDGTEVQSVTMDGITIWQKLVNAGILRSIEVGDNLTGKTLYLGFPDDLYITLPADYQKAFITGDKSNGSIAQRITSDNGLKINRRSSITLETLYEVDSTTHNIITNLSSYTMNIMAGSPSEFGIVTEVDKTHPAYQYVKIIDDGLRNIGIGDNLSGKEIYVDIPSGMDFLYTGTVIGTSVNLTLIYQSTVGSIEDLSINDTVVFSRPSSGTPTTETKVFIMLDNMGIVDYIDDTLQAYPFIKIRKEPFYRNIIVGDDLSGQTLYCAFPDDLYKQQISSSDITFIQSFSVAVQDTFMLKYFSIQDDESVVYIDRQYDGFVATLYDHLGSTIINIPSILLHQYFGTVTAIDKNCTAYKYIFIKSPPIICLAVGAEDKVFSSTDGRSWAPLTTGLGVNGTVYSVAYGKNLFVLGHGNAGVSGNISTSSNGTTWTHRYVPALSGYVFALLYANEMFVAGTLSGQLATSSDGVSWTSRVSSFDTTGITKIIYASGLYVAVGMDGKLATSSDAITWTQRTSTFGTTMIRGLTYGNGLFIIVGDSGKMATSTDGISWTARTSSFGTSGIYRVKYYNGLFIAVGDNGKIATSSNGTSWSQKTSGTTSTIYSISYQNGCYIVGTGSGKLFASFDGTTWTARSINWNSSSTIFEIYSLQNN